MKLNIAHNFTENLPADSFSSNKIRQVNNACYSFVTPKITKRPELIHVSKEMLELLGISVEASKTNDFLKVFTGNKVVENTTPYAMCYGGHQFGHWAG